jgi:hypothetical protein
VGGGTELRPPGRGERIVEEHARLGDVAAVQQGLAELELRGDDIGVLRGQLLLRRERLAIMRERPVRVARRGVETRHRLLDVRLVGAAVSGPGELRARLVVAFLAHEGIDRVEAIPGDQRPVVARDLSHGLERRAADGQRRLEVAEVELRLALVHAHLERTWVHRTVLAERVLVATARVVDASLELPDVDGGEAERRQLPVVERAYGLHLRCMLLEAGEAHDDLSRHPERDTSRVIDEALEGGVGRSSIDGGLGDAGPVVELRRLPRVDVLLREARRGLPQQSVLARGQRLGERRPERRDRLVALAQIRIGAGAPEVDARHERQETDLARVVEETLGHGGRTRRLADGVGRHHGGQALLEGVDLGGGLRIARSRRRRSQRGNVRAAVLR